MSVHDVAEFVLAELGGMTTLRLHRFVYWSQAWHLAWEGVPLFDEEIVAWMGGPHVHALREVHGPDVFKIEEWSKGEPEHLESSQRETVRSVCRFYDEYPTFVLGQLVRQERPWLLGRVNIGPDEKEGLPIEHDWMREYYASL